MELFVPSNLKLLRWPRSSFVDGFRVLQQETQARAWARSTNAFLSSESGSRWRHGGSRCASWLGGCSWCFRGFCRILFERFAHDPCRPVHWCTKPVLEFAMSAWLFFLVGSRQSTTRQVCWSANAERTLFDQACFVTASCPLAQYRTVSTHHSTHS